MRTQHGNPDLVARAPRATRTDAPAADAGALIGRAGPRPAEPLGRGEVLQLQRSAGNAAVARLLGGGRSPVLDVVGRGGGRPLEAGAREQMEGALEQDFGDVRIHTGAEASRSAESVQARAYTVGNEIVFGDSAYAPGTHDGDRRLAHELTHVVQQREGPVDGTPQSDGIAVSSPSDRFEQAARANADRVVAQIASGHDRTIQQPAAAGPRRETASRRGSEGGAHSPSQVSVQRESADLLEKLAEPKIGKPQAKEVQIELVKRLDELFKRESEFNLGGILIDHLPDSDSDLLKNAKLVPLPHNILFEDKMVTEFKSVGEDRAQEVIGAGLGPLVVENTLKTMIDARQIEYLRKAKLPNDEWKILVEVHYISARPKDMSGFHKDTKNETLFVNLNYHVGERDVVGPEYVVNPEPPEEHEAKVAGNLPPAFLEDLKQTRKRLGEPTEIKFGIVGPYGYVAFVDEAIHHTTPHYGQRIVTGEELGWFLEQQSAQFREMKRARAQYQSSNWPSKYWPFESYVNKSIVKEKEIPTWQAWLDMAGDANKKTTYTRDELVEKKKMMNEDEFELMLATVGGKEGAVRPGGRAGGFEKVLVNAKAVPVDPTGRRTRLKRRMSYARFARPEQLPDTVTRRFLRTWVRAIPAKKARKMEDLLKLMQSRQPAATSGENKD